VDKPDDYVIATGESHSIRELLDVSFGQLDLDWKKHVEIDPRYFRPAEVDLLVGDASKAQRQLGWKPKVHFRELIQQMVAADLGLVEEEMGLRPATPESKISALSRMEH
jgi:GDPmannose 4,6-dehydratase